MSLDNLASAVQTACKLKGEFKLRSGATSDTYFDKYLFEGDPSLMRQITGHLAELLPKGCVLAGLEMGGISIATWLSGRTHSPMIQVRKKAKDYGTRKLAEGRVNLHDTDVCIIEDVVTTGGQIIETAKELRKLGAKVKDVVCVILRGDTAVELLAAEGLKLRPLFVMRDGSLFPA